MITLTGKKVSEGIVIGKLVFYKRDERENRRIYVKDVEKEVAAAAAAPAVHEEEPPAVKEEKKKNKPGFWKKFKERLEDWTNTVTEE